MIASTLALKRLICRVLIGVLVSTQFAIAAYACPGFGQAGPEHAAMSGSPGSAAAELVSMIDSAGDAAAGAPGQPQHSALDPMLPNLCMAHCQYGQQSAEHTPAPALAPVLLTALYTLPALDRTTAAGGRAAAPAGGPPVAVDPPHAILHCCLRD